MHSIGAVGKRRENVGEVCKLSNLAKTGKKSLQGKKSLESTTTFHWCTERQQRCILQKTGKPFEDDYGAVMTEITNLRRE